MRTNIELDEELVTELMESTGIKTKRKLIHEALLALRRKQQLEWALAQRGQLTSWEGDIEAGRIEDDRAW